MTNNITVDNSLKLGYSGGMALYVANWQSVMYLFKIVATDSILPSLNYLTNLN